MDLAGTSSKCCTIVSWVNVKEVYYEEVQSKRKRTFQPNVNA